MYYITSVLDYLQDDTSHSPLATLNIMSRPYWYVIDLSDLSVCSMSSEDIDLNRGNFFKAGRDFTRCEFIFDTYDVFDVKSQGIKILSGEGYTIQWGYVKRILHEAMGVLLWDSIPILESPALGRNSSLLYAFIQKGYLHLRLIFHGSLVSLVVNQDGEILDVDTMHGKDQVIYHSVSTYRAERLLSGRKYEY